MNRDHYVSSSTDICQTPRPRRSPSPEYRIRRERRSPSYDDNYKRSPKSPKIELNDSEPVMVYYPVPEHCVGLVIGRDGVEIQMISQQSGCRVQVATDRSTNGYRMFEIYGLPPNVDAAKALIEQVVDRSTTRAPVSSIIQPAEQPKRRVKHTTFTIQVPPNKCGHVIGRNGETMKKLRSWTGCRITMIQNDGQADIAKPLKIVGEPEAVEKAKRLIFDILDTNDNLPAAAVMAGNGAIGMHVLNVTVPRSSVGAIIGLKGANIRRIAEETGTKIQFRDDDDPKKMNRMLSIIGKETKVNVAAQLIAEIVEANCTDDKTPISLFYMDVPGSKCGLVIGKGGETIKQINSESGAHCELAREEDQNPMERTFVIRGSDLQVEHAKHLIRQRVGDIPLHIPFDVHAYQQQKAMEDPYYAQMWHQQQLQQQQQQFQLQQQQIQQQHYQAMQLQQQLEHERQQMLLQQQILQQQHVREHLKQKLQEQHLSLSPIEDTPPHVWNGRPQTPPTPKGTWEDFEAELEDEDTDLKEIKLRTENLVDQLARHPAAKKGVVDNEKPPVVISAYTRLFGVPGTHMRAMVDRAMRKHKGYEEALRAAAEISGGDPNPDTAAEAEGLANDKLRAWYIAKYKRTALALKEAEETQRLKEDIATGNDHTSEWFQYFKAIGDQEGLAAARERMDRIEALKKTEKIIKKEEPRF